MNEKGRAKAKEIEKNEGARLREKNVKGEQGRMCQRNATSGVSVTTEEVENTPAR